MVYLQMLDTPEEKSKFEVVYEEYSGLMYILALKYLRNSQDAEDAVHQAFLSVAENFNKVDEPICPRTKGYLVTIVENKAIDMYRKKTCLEEVAYEEDILGVPAEYAGDSIITDCILKLPAKYREVILLRYCYGLETDEIAKAMGISKRNVLVIGQRARAKLYKMCEKEGIL